MKKRLSHEGKKHCNILAGTPSDDFLRSPTPTVKMRTPNILERVDYRVQVDIYTQRSKALSWLLSENGDPIIAGSFVGLLGLPPYSMIIFPLFKCVTEADIFGS